MNRGAGCPAIDERLPAFVNILACGRHTTDLPHPAFKRVGDPAPPGIAEGVDAPVADGVAALVGGDGVVRDDSWIEVFRSERRTLAVVQATGPDYF
jgi:hypothetical protein